MNLYYTYCYKLLYGLRNCILQLAIIGGSYEGSRACVCVCVLSFNYKLTFETVYMLCRLLFLL